MIAALFVSERGPYIGLPDVDPWPASRDARLYAGPWPVVAHPPCERWGRFWFGGPQWLKAGHPRKMLGADAECFASALASVRRFGGVLEHPADSHAWRYHWLRLPDRAGGWVPADFDGGWTCCVDQGHYGHRGQKATWLYVNRVQLPGLIWGKAPRRVFVDASTEAGRRRQVRTGSVQLMSKRERTATPIPFRDLLLDMARSVKARAA